MRQNRQTAAQVHISLRTDSIGFHAVSFLKSVAGADAFVVH